MEGDSVSTWCQYPFGKYKISPGPTMHFMGLAFENKGYFSKSTFFKFMEEVLKSSESKGYKKDESSGWNMVNNLNPTTWQNKLSLASKCKGVILPTVPILNKNI